MTELAWQFALAAVPALFAIILHELAHGYAALALGDDTARRMGRLSLNPLVHVDRVGTILLPGALLLGQLLTIGHVAFLFGWAKPVPVAAWRFANPRRTMMIVAAAGPVMNVLLAWLAALLMHATEALSAPWQQPMDQALLYFILANLVLGLFNLLPVPPMDGGRILVGLLPERLAHAWARLERAGIIAVLGVVVLLPVLLRQFGVAFDPVGGALRAVVPWALAWVLRLAGHGGWA